MISAQTFLPFPAVLCSGLWLQSWAGETDADLRSDDGLDQSRAVWPLNALNLKVSLNTQIWPLCSPAPLGLYSPTQDDSENGFFSVSCCWTIKALDWARTRQWLDFFQGGKTEKSNLDKNKSSRVIVPLKSLWILCSFFHWRTARLTDVTIGEIFSCCQDTFLCEESVRDSLLWQFAAIVHFSSTFCLAMWKYFWNYFLTTII